MSSSFYKAVFFMTLMHLWVGGALCAQSTQLHFKHFTTEDGLPSSETYVVFEDHEGYIWIGTDNGVARYDGYEFEVFDSNDGLEDVVVFTILQDSEGRIWVGTLSGKAYYFEYGEFHAYRHNDAIFAIRNKSEFIHLIDVQKDGEVVFRLLNSGLFIVNNIGDVRPLMGEDSKDFFYYVPTCEGEGIRQLAPIKRNYPKTATKDIFQKTKEGAYRIILGNESCRREIAKPTLRIGIGSMWPISFLLVVSKGDGEVAYFFQRPKVHILQGDEEQAVIELGGKEINFALPVSADKFWLAYDGGGGVSLINFDSSRLKIEESHLVGKSISYIAQDQRGGMWVSTIDAGVFYSPFPNQRKHSINPGAKALAIAVTGEASFYVSYSDASIYQVDVEYEQVLELKMGKQILSNSCDYMLYDEPSNKIIADIFSADHLPINERRNDIYFRAHEVNATKNINGMRRLSFSSFLGNRKGLAANAPFFGILDLDSLSTDFIYYDKNLSAYAFYIDADGRYLIGTLNGLMEFDPKHPDSTIRRIDFGIKELNARIVAIEEYEGGMLFGTRGEGLVYLKDGVAQIVKEKHGLASNMIRDIDISDAGEVWLASLNGLSKVVFGDNGPIVRTFRSEHGLIDNEIHDLDVYKNEVWIATSSGVQKFVEPPFVEHSPTPNLRRFIIDGDTVVTAENLKINPGYHNVSIFFSTTNFALSDQINYRYRLEADGPWEYTDQRLVTFPKLGAGDYYFSVASQNEDEIWSESLNVHFTIVEYWYKTWPAILGSLLLFAASISLFFLRRERNRSREQDLLLQINQLEHEALHAQMNPHFVFNALNSIQNFVLHNDAKQAATYLSRFALVIRQTLRSSVKGKHSLKEEVEMLKTYLLLEKLRFKEGFNYQIAIAPSLDQDQIMLPPLMIQPFVENAIIHGLSVLEAGGKISVSFKGNRQALKVEIEDNGIGYNKDNTPDEESYGMEITRKRLAAMKGKNQKVSRMQVEPLYAEDGKLRGTSVSLLIQL